MRLSFLAMAAVATLATAAPLKIVVITAVGQGESNSLSAIRFGHAAAGRTSQPGGHYLLRPSHGDAVAAAPVMQHKGCGGSLRAKMDRISAKWRTALGLPSIKEFKQLDAPFEPHVMGGPEYNYGTFAFAPAGWPAEHHGHHGQAHGKHDKFMYRLCRALSLLGPWEGRAVAFVLGCGIGVLLRMVVVLCTLFLRARRASLSAAPIQLPVNQADNVTAELIFDEKVHEVIVVDASHVKPSQ